MAEDQDSNVPPRPSEASKVQPKKETVRISLPPKPTASPTIKLPALPPSGAGGGSGAPAPAARPAPAATPASSSAPKAAPKPAAKPAAAAAPAGRTAAPGKAPVPARRAPAPSRSAAGPTVLDNVLAIVAIVVSVAAVGNLVYLLSLITDNPTGF